MIKPFLLLLAVSSASLTDRQSGSPSPSYQQEVVYPSSSDIFRGSFSIGKQPVQVSAGIRLGPPPFRLPHFSPPTPNFEFLPQSGRSRGESSVPFLFPLPLFTPNTKRRPVATRGQVYEFNKALEEEEEEEKRVMEKESGIGSRRQYNGLEDFGKSNLNFVSVQSDHYNYNYTL